VVQRLAASSGLKGGRNGESSANNKGLTFSLSCCFRSGPLWWSHRRNLLHFLSSDERRASSRGARKKESQGERANPGQVLPQIAVAGCRWSTGLEAKILSNLSLIMVGPVLLCYTVWALLLDLPKDPISGPNQGPSLEEHDVTRGWRPQTTRWPCPAGRHDLIDSSREPRGPIPGCSPHSGSRAKPMDRPIPIHRIAPTGRPLSGAHNHIASLYTSS